MSVEHELERAVNAASVADRVAALCRAWALAPSQRIATLIHDVRAEPVAGANQEAREVAWLALAARATVDDIPMLLATPWSKKPRDAQNRLSFFERFGADPRVARALLELDTGTRYTTAAGNQFWRGVYSLLLRWGSAEAAQRIPRDMRAFPDTSPWSGQRFIGIFEPLVVEWNDRWPREPSLSERAVELLERMESQSAPSRRLQRELLDTVYEKSDDDTVRLVLADALTEQGDPRGEFIVLQFAHARGELPMGERERMERLLRANGRTWLDGLDAQVSPPAVFKKGFAEEVRIATRRPDAGFPPWRIVEVLDAAAIATSLSEFLKHANTTRIREVRSLHGGSLQELARNGSERTLRLLEVANLGAREFATPTWRAETLRLLAPIDEAAWWLAGASSRLKPKRVELQLNGSFERVGAVLKELEVRAPEIEVISFDFKSLPWPSPWLGHWKLEFTRVDGRFTTANLLLANAAFDGALAALKSAELKRLAVHVTSRRGPSWRDATTNALLEVFKKSKLELMTPTRSEPAPVVFDGT